MSRETFFIGSYTIADDWIPNAGGEGISALELELETGRLEHRGVRARIDSPSCLMSRHAGRQTRTRGAGPSTTRRCLIPSLSEELPVRVDRAT